MPYFYGLFEKNKYIFKSFEGVKFAVIGMIMAIMVRYIFSSFTSWKGVLFIMLGFALTYWLKLHPIVIVIGAALAALLVL